MIFSFIAEHSREWPVRVQCRVLRVSVRGYRAWCQRERRRQEGEVSPRQEGEVSPRQEGEVSPRQREEFRLLLHIRAAHKQGRLVYGSPRVHRLLRTGGIYVSRKRVARIMRQNGLRGAQRRRRKPCTTQSNHSLGVAPNLLNRKFLPEEVGGLDRVWCGDITYLPSIWGWLYLAVVLDAFSRRVVGWELSHTLEAELVVQALDKAVATRGCHDRREDHSHDGPEWNRLFHSDQGSQYASRKCAGQLMSNGITPSMSRKANCWDNALMESFFGSFKSELVDQLPNQRFDNIEHAYRLIADYIDNFYNRVRLHSTLDYVSPVAYEMAHQAEQQSSN